MERSKTDSKREGCQFGDALKVGDALKFRDALEFGDALEFVDALKFRWRCKILELGAGAGASSRLVSSLGPRWTRVFIQVIGSWCRNLFFLL